MNKEDLSPHINKNVGKQKNKKKDKNHLFLDLNIEN